MAQSVIGALRAELSAGVAKFADDMGKAGKSVQKFSKKFKRVGRDMQGAGRAMTLGLTAPLAVFGEASRRAARDFGKSMSDISTLVDTTKEDMASMKREVLAIGRDVPVAISDLTAGLYDVRSAGIAAADSIGVLKQSAKLAVAGLGTTKEAVDLVTSSINAFNLQGEEKARVYDMIFTTVKTGKTTISKLAQGFGAVAGTVAQAGVQLDDYLSSVAALTTTGLPAAQAHTQIRAAIVGLLRETKQSAALFDHLGVKTFPELIKKAGGMVPAFQQIVAALGGNDAALIKVLGSTEAYNAVIGLAGNQNQAYTDTLANMRDGASEVDEAFKKQNETAAASEQRWKNTMQAMQISVGQILLPVIEKMQRALTGIAAKFNSLDPETKKWIVTIGALVAGIGPVIFVMGTLISSFGTLIKIAPALITAFRGIGIAIAFMGGPITLLITALAGLAAAWIFYGDQIQNYVSGWIEAIAHYFKSLARTWGQIITGDFKGALNTIKSIFSKTGKALKGELVKGAKDTGKEVVEGIKKDLEDSAPKVEPPAKDLGNTIGEGIGEGIGVGIMQNTASTDALNTKLQALRDQIFPIQAAMDTYREKMKLAEQAGIDLAVAHQVLRDEAFSAAGGLDAVKDKLETLPALFREAARAAKESRAQEEAARNLKRQADEMERLGHSMNMQFDPEARYNTRIAEIEKAWEAGTLSPKAYEAAVKDAWDTFQKGAKEGEDGMKQVSQALDRASQSLTDMLMGTKDFETGMRELFSNLTQSLFIEPAMQKLQKDLKGLLAGIFKNAGSGGGSGGGGGAGWAGFISSIFGAFAGARAMGGMVQAHRPYLVGERGPEVFRPAASGMIEANGTGAGGGVTQVFNISTPNADSFRRSERQIMRGARQKLASQGVG